MYAYNVSQRVIAFSHTPLNFIFIPKCGRQLPWTHRDLSDLSIQWFVLVPSVF